MGLFLRYTLDPHGRSEQVVRETEAALPILDAAGRPVAVVSVWGPSERLSEDRFPALGTLAVAAAAAIAGRRTPTL